MQVFPPLLIDIINKRYIENIQKCALRICSGMWAALSLVPQTPICTHVDRGSGNIVYQRVVLNSGMWRDQSDRLVCNQHYVMH